MNLRDILLDKGREVFTIGPAATLREVAQELVRRGVGALVVVAQPADEHRAEELLGIISERDLLRACASGAAFDRLRVAEVMSTQLITGSPDDQIEAVMGLMTSQRKRHLPVVGEGRLLGIVSIGDLVKAEQDRLAVENRFMKDYIRS